MWVNKQIIIITFQKETYILFGVGKFKSCVNNTRCTFEGWSKVVLVLLIKISAPWRMFDAKVDSMPGPFFWPLSRDTTMTVSRWIAAAAAAAAAAQAMARSTGVRVVNPFPVDLDVRAEVNQQQDVPNSVTFYFLLLFTGGIIASRFYTSKKIAGDRGKIRFVSWPPAIFLCARVCSPLLARDIIISRQRMFMHL